jgi:parallel beta-helix repeat protein
MTTTITVTNAAGLVGALRAARGGETILLAPGSYGDVSLSGMKPLSTVTIRSADADNDAVFRTLKLTNVSNMVFDDIDVRHVLRPGQQEFEAAIRVNKSSDIAFVGIDASGSLNGNSFDDGNGIMVVGGSRIAVLDSTFTEFNNAAVFGGVSDVIFAGNAIRTVREGVNLSRISGGLFERNFVADIAGDPSRGDHPDAFQVHSNVSRDLVFNANVIMGNNSHGIFIRNEQFATTGQEHSNIVITNNYIESNARNAIAVRDVDGFLISNNTIRDTGLPGLVPGMVIVNLSNGVISGNVVPLMDGQRGADLVNANVVVSNNIDIWDTKQKRGVSDASLFAAPTGTDDLDFSALGVRPGSAADSAGAGFRAVAGIGNLGGSAATQLAAYLPQFEGNFAAAYPL